MPVPTGSVGGVATKQAKPDVRAGSAPSGMPQIADAGVAQMTPPVAAAQNQGGGQGAGGGGNDGHAVGGGGLTLPNQPGAPAPHPGVDLSSHYQGGVDYSGGPTALGIRNMQQSFSDPNRLQGAMPFWQTPSLQIAGQHGYDPGQQFAGQDVTGSLIQNNPMVAAALSNYNQNVLPGIQDQFNTMGLGRSTAAGNAMARGQASMLEPLYSQAANLENDRIQRQMQAGEFSAGLDQNQLNRMMSGSEAQLGRDERSHNAQQQAQQQLFENMMAMQGQQFSQGQQGSQQLFDMGGQARDYGQQANQAAQQDFLRRMGLSEEAINPFGGISGLLGSVTNGK